MMIHYPEDKMAQMVEGLASHADERLIISFAPNTWYYRALKSFGELFPGPSKTTRACESIAQTGSHRVTPGHSETVSARPSGGFAPSHARPLLSRVRVAARPLSLQTFTPRSRSSRPSITPVSRSSGRR